MTKGVRATGRRKSIFGDDPDDDDDDDDDDDNDDEDV